MPGPRVLVLENLRTRQNFLRVQTSGRAAKGRYLMLLVAPRVERNGAPRIGFTVSRRVGIAVVRNRVRRRLREACRLHQTAFLTGHDHVIIAFDVANDAPYVALERELKWLLGRVKRRCGSGSR